MQPKIGNTCHTCYRPRGPGSRKKYRWPRKLNRQKKIKGKWKKKEQQRLTVCQHVGPMLWMSCCEY